MKTERVPPEKLRRTIDPESFDFRTTAQIEPLRGTTGQERALEAIALGLDMRGSCLEPSFQESR